jgi:hypothetical protein
MVTPRTSLNGMTMAIIGVAILMAALPFLRALKSDRGLMLALGPL